ncbi:MAG: NAD(P)H-dependent oxidoreductase [Phycisphaeraceae bacterium]|nr:NAD(P)H-dependent oxidoreductase [Phycisphaeraceae bacterium]
MQTFDPHAVVERLGWRYATKKFDPGRKIPADRWAALEKAMILAPSSYGLQPWRFVVVNDATLRAKLRAVSWNQPQITDASHLVVFCRRAAMTPADVERYVQRIVDVRAVPAAALEQYKNMMLGTVKGLSAEQSGAWNGRQVYIALGFFLSAAAMLGIDACPMEGFDGAKYDEILGLPAEGYHAQVVATAGYRAPDDEFGKMAKVRFADADVVKHR